MITIASVNCAGLRGSNLTGKAAQRGFSMAKWLKNSSDIDILAIQETRVNEIQVRDPLLKLGIDYDNFFFQQDMVRKGHAGVALVALKGGFTNIQTPFESLPITKTKALSGRWIEGDYKSENGSLLKVICAYLHHADSPKVKLSNGKFIDRAKAVKSMDDKHTFMALVTQRLRQLASEYKKTKVPYVVVGDFNIAHHKIDIKNYQGNIDKAGFLPEERAWLSLWMPDKVSESLGYVKNTRLDYQPPKTEQFNQGQLDLVDVHRQLIGQTAEYTWWSNRGRAFDNNTGWRIDYQMACPVLARVAKKSRVDKAARYDQRWSDHAPLVVRYEL
ncbi:MAG: endonuclease/exonuclease/phosphatase family protein [Bifidobacteriaceae bacterium]|jgi:exodeoxyribonuclease-3|nr:endonuclease/exonuclease/phosphatase family protein [Bifidobacteriaceae bacterium]